MGFPPANNHTFNFRSKNLNLYTYFVTNENVDARL